MNTQYSKFKTHHKKVGGEYGGGICPAVRYPRLTVVGDRNVSAPLNYDKSSIANAI